MRLPQLGDIYMNSRTTKLQDCYLCFTLVRYTEKNCFNFELEDDVWELLWNDGMYTRMIDRYLQSYVQESHIHLLGGF